MPDAHPALSAVLPELATATFSEEILATCGNCPMLAKHGDDASHPRWFNPAVRCCTYHPKLPCFLVGRVLSRGDAGTERMRLRMQDPDGVTAHGVRPNAATAHAYRTRGPAEFGRAEALKCPYWVGGEKSCGIWQDRGAVCRTWYCKHVEGDKGQQAWLALRDAQLWAEVAIARWLVSIGPAPADGASQAAYEAWFLWCAWRLDRATPAELSALRDADADRLVGILAQISAQRDAPMPDILAPTVMWIESTDTGVRLSAASGIDLRDYPNTVFALLAQMDGKRPWREALAGAEADVGPLGEDMVRELYRLGLLEAREDKAVPHGASVAFVEVKTGGETYRWEPPIDDPARPTITSR